MPSPRKPRLKQEPPRPRPPAVPFKRSGRPRPPTPDATVSHEYRRDRGPSAAGERAKAERREARDQREKELAAVTEPRLREVAALRQGWVPPRWTPTTCIEVLQAFYARQGRSPTMREFANARRGTLPHPSTICRLFGSWSAGLAAAGLPLNRTVSSSPRWTNEQILAAIRAAALAGDPTSRPFQLGQRRPWIGTIERRFGSWRVAQERAGVAGPADRS